MGNKWSKISKMLLGRTENAVKVRWKALDRAAKKNASLGDPKTNDALSKNGKNGRGSLVRLKSSEGMRRVESAGARRSSESRSSGKFLLNSLDGTMDFDVGVNLNNSLEDGRSNNVSTGIPIGDVADYSTMFGNSNDGDMMQMSFDVDDDADVLSSQGGNRRSSSKSTSSRSQGRSSNKGGESWTELMMFDDPAALNFDVADVFDDD